MLSEAVREDALRCARAGRLLIAPTSTRFVGVYHCDAAIAEGYKSVFVQRVELFISSLTAAVSKDMATLPIAHTWPGYQAGKGRIIMSSIKPERSSTRSSTEETGMSSA